MPSVQPQHSHTPNSLTSTLPWLQGTPIMTQPEGPKWTLETLLFNAEKRGFSPDDLQVLELTVKSLADRTRTCDSRKSEEQRVVTIVTMILDVRFRILNAIGSVATAENVLWVIGLWKKLVPKLLHYRKKQLADPKMPYTVAVVKKMSIETLRATIQTKVIEASVARQILLPLRATFDCETGSRTEYPYRYMVADMMIVDNERSCNDALRTFERLLKILDVQSEHDARETMKALLLVGIKSPQFKQSGFVWQKFGWKVHAVNQAINMVMTPAARKCATQVILGLAKCVPAIGSYEVVKMLLIQHSSPQAVENWLAAHEVKAEVRTNLLSLLPQNMPLALCDYRRGFETFRWQQKYGYRVVWPVVEEGLEHGVEQEGGRPCWSRWNRSPEKREGDRAIKKYLTQDVLQDSERPEVFRPNGNKVEYTRKKQPACTPYQAGVMTNRGQQLTLLHDERGKPIKKLRVINDGDGRGTELPWCQQARQTYASRLTLLLQSQPGNMWRRNDVGSCNITNLDDRYSRDRVLIDRKVAITSNKTPMTWTDIRKGLRKNNPDWKRMAQCIFLCTARAGRDKTRRPSLPQLPEEIVVLLLEAEFYLWPVPRKEPILIQEVD